MNIIIIFFILMKGRIFTKFVPRKMSFVILLLSCYLYNVSASVGVTVSPVNPTQETDDTYTCSDMDCYITEEHCLGM